MAKKKLYDENGNVVRGKIKKPFYKKVWFWIVAIILIAIIGGSLGGEDTASNTESKDNTEKTTSKKETKKEDDSNLKADYDTIVIGDLLGGGDGTSYDEVVAKFGEPDSTSDSEIEGVVTKMATWSGLKGGDIISSLSISFNDNKAVSKGVSGLKVSKHEKATLEQFNSVNTDGSYSYEQAVETFGEPDGFSETLLNGVSQNMAMWTSNVDGDLGANFNITFEDGTAVAKSQYSMK